MITESFQNLQESLDEKSVNLLPNEGETLEDSSASIKEEYPGDYVDSTPEPEGGYQIKNGLDFADPFIMLCFFDKDISDGHVTLHHWQMEDLKKLGSVKPTSQHPYKYCLVASNGSGKDKYVIAPFSVWFILTKIRSRCIITTASGTQLTSQTEPYIKDLCEKINGYFGQEIFIIRQRYIKCTVTGSEIRMFATDEAGKAEGYHPMDANSEMVILENEAKSISDEIDRALKRCSGYNFWLKVSSAGEPKGHFYYAVTHWPNVRTVTSYDCPHISQDEIQEDIVSEGETSAYFRSKHLSLFTTIAGLTVISPDLVAYCLQFPPDFVIDFPLRIGIDLAAGGDENWICFTKGNRVIKEDGFKDKNTTIGTNRIESILKQNNIDKKYKHIYADDGGIGRAIIDNLVDRGWNINRIMNQWSALGNKKQFGNRGAENWYRVARILEEKFFDLTTLTSKTIEQLQTRKYKQTLTGGRMFLQLKREAIAHGFPSPDRADAFILSLTGLTVEDFIGATTKKKEKVKIDNRPRISFETQDAIHEHYENEVTYDSWKPENTTKRKSVFSSLRNLIHSSN